MKAVKKMLAVLLTMIVILSLSAVTVFADHTQVYNLSDEELYDRVWTQIQRTCFDMSKIKQSTEDGDVYDTLIMTISKVELDEFLKQYTAPNIDIDIADVEHTYYDWCDEVYDDANIEREKTDNGYIEYNVNTPDKKYYWTYNQTTDSYVCTDESNKIVNSYPKYYYEGYEEYANSTNSSVETSSETSTVTSISEQPVTAYESSSPTSTSSKPVTTTSGNSEMVTSDNGKTDDVPVYEEETDNNGGMSSIQTIILIVIGVLIVAGIVVIIVMLAKKQKEDKK